MVDAVQDAKQQAILKAAFQSFAQYGFKRTSMEDIARAAGVSRPALYMHFKNKEDVFRSLSQKFYDETTEQVRLALLQPGPPEKVLKAAFYAQYAQINEVILNSPHGNELVDTSHTVSADVAKTGDEKIAEVYADWMTREAEAGRIRLTQPAATLARTMIGAQRGVKQPPYADFLSQLAVLADLIGRGLAAR